MLVRVVAQFSKLLAVLTSASPASVDSLVNVFALFGHVNQLQSQTDTLSDTVDSHGTAVAVQMA